MKVGYITEPNSKGQIVIPVKLRRALGITSDTPLNLVLRGEGIYVYPIDEVLTKTESKDDMAAYLELLDKTQGTWAGDTWEKTRAKRRKIELAASKRRKTKW